MKTSLKERMKSHFVRIELMMPSCKYNENAYFHTSFVEKLHFSDGSEKYMSILIQNVQNFKPSLHLPQNGAFGLVLRITSTICCTKQFYSSLVNVGTTLWSPVRWKNVMVSVSTNLNFLPHHTAMGKPFYRYSLLSSCCVRIICEFFVNNIINF